MSSYIPWLNQNRFDGQKGLLRTLSMGYSGENYKNYQNSRRWGVVNREVGQKADTCLVVSGLSGFILDYLNFLGDSQGVILGGLKKFFTAMSSSFEGERDNLMYHNLYGMGIDKNLSKKEILNQLEAVESGKISAPDDWMENRLQQELYGEEIVAGSGELATKAARVKPVANLISSILPSEYKRLIDTVLDLPAKCYWRLRFFGGSLHANFVTSTWKLVKNGIGALFSESSKKALNEHISDLHSKSVDYFKDINQSNVVDGIGEPSLKLYGRMLMDRMAEHWRGIWHPAEVIKEKKEKGLIKDGELGKHESRRQKLSSITDFSAPICASLGLIGAIVFDPLSKILAISKIETGKNLINALSSSRKLFQLVNYIPRFIIPEFIAGGDAVKGKYEDAVNGEGKNDPDREVERQLYYAHKSRYNNAILGFMVAAVNIVEPFGHLIGLGNSENRFSKLMFDMITRFGDTGFLKFFTKRREAMGRESFLLSLLREKQFNSGSEVDIKDLGYSLESIEGKAKETLDQAGVKITDMHDVISKPVEKVLGTISADQSFVRVGYA